MSAVLPELARALVRWQHAAGPYWPYVCAAPFLGSVQLPPRSAATPDAAVRAIAEAAPALSASCPTAIFIDLPVERTLPASAELRERGFLVVPVIQRWTAPDAVLPCGPLVSLLMRTAPRHRAIHPLGVAFLLDGARAGPDEDAGRNPSPRRFDNRYRYPICRFPPARFLLAGGIGAVRWLSQRGVAPDLLDYARTLTQAGLQPEPATLTPSPD